MDELKSWSQKITVNKSVVTLQQGSFLRTPTGKITIIIPTEEVVEGRVAFHHENEGEEEKTWRADWGYKLYSGTSIQAVGRDLNFVLLGITQSSPGTAESQDTMKDEMKD
jgi:hypothetical protein